MAIQVGSSKGGAIADINVTPLVDVTLVLLIIFMVTAQLIVTRGIKIDTPTTKSGQTVKQSPLVVTIDKDKKLLINGKQYKNDQAIKTLIRRLIAENKKIKGAKPLKAIITADKPKWLHYGKAQTEATLTEKELSKGKHKLTLQYGDWEHKSYGPTLSHTITVTVK